MVGRFKRVRCKGCNGSGQRTVGKGNNACPVRCWDCDGQGSFFESEDKDGR